MPDPNMTLYIFTENFTEFTSRQREQALAKLNKLPERDVLEPGLAGKIDRIVGESCFQVAALIPGSHKGVRRTAVVDPYSRHVETVEIVEVSFRFSGSGDSFDYELPDFEEIEIPSCATGDTLVANFSDDDNLKEEVDTYIRDVSANLLQLRKAMETFQAELSAALQSAGREWHAYIKARKERDKELGFPIE